MYYDTEGNVVSSKDVNHTALFIVKSDGTFVWTDGQNSESSTWKLTGDKLLLGDEVYRVLKLTDDELVLRWYDSEQGYENPESYGKKGSVEKYRRITDEE